MSLDDTTINHWKSWVGKTETRREFLDREALRRFALALGEDGDIDRVQPSLGHWAFFLPMVPHDEIGPDGHRKRGGFLPPVSLPRRMFAAGDFSFGGVLAIGEEAEQVSTVRSVMHKRGRTGELILVEVEYRLVQGGVDKVSEVQTIIYREAGERMPAIIPAQRARSADDVLWEPDPVELFRFSAVTFNGHRIHYDQPYATREEGYPGLVVHGPLIAARLFGLARRRGQPIRFNFRATAPTFAGQPILLTIDEAEEKIAALRCDGRTAMSASVQY